MVACILFFGGLFLGYKIFRPAAKEEITSNVILTALQSEGFLVSQNYIIMIFFCNLIDFQSKYYH